MPQPEHLCQFSGCCATATAQVLWDEDAYCRLCTEHAQGVCYEPTIAEAI